MKAGRGGPDRKRPGQRQGLPPRGMATNDTPGLWLIALPSACARGGGWNQLPPLRAEFQITVPSHCFVHVTIVFTVPQLGGELAHYGLVHLPYLASALLNNLPSC